jgi:DNA topoisomerase IB
VPGYLSFERPEDMVAKARRDLAAFDADPSADDLWNAVVTTNHIWDWVHLDRTFPETLRASKPSMENSDDLKLVKDLAEGLKHFERQTETPDTHRRLEGGAILGHAMLGQAMLGSPGVTCGCTSEGLAVTGGSPRADAM